jgi:hypothetical protein
MCDSTEHSADLGTLFTEEFLPHGAKVSTLVVARAERLSRVHGPRVTGRRSEVTKGVAERHEGFAAV